MICLANQAGVGRGTPVPLSQNDMIYRADLAIRTEHFFIALTIHEPSYTKQSAQMGGGLSFFADADHHSRTGGPLAHLGCGLSLDPMAGFPLVVPVCPADTSSHD